MAYKLQARGDLLVGAQQVGDLVLPGHYEMNFEPNSDEPGPALRLVFEVRDGVPQCREIHLLATEHGREVRRSDLRIAIEDHLEWATVSMVMPQDGRGRRQDAALVLTMDPVELDAFRGVVQSVRRTARRKGPAEPELREAAEIYRSAEHAPTAAVAARFGIAHRTASLWISRARKLGYL
jgi:hypothetical protein